MTTRSSQFETTNKYEVKTDTLHPSGCVWFLWFLSRHAGQIS